MLVRDMNFFLRKGGGGRRQSYYRKIDYWQAKSKPASKVLLVALSTGGVFNQVHLASLQVTRSLPVRFKQYSFLAIYIAEWLT